MVRLQVRLRFEGLVVGSILVGCTRAGTPSPSSPPIAAEGSPTREDESSEAEPERASIVDVIAALELVGPGGDEVWLDDGPAVRACEKAGFAEALPAAMASQLGPLSAGARLSIVHPAGVAEPNVVTVRCQAPEQPEESGWAALVLSSSVPPRAEAYGLASESYVMVAGLRVNPNAKLHLPTPTTEVDAAMRATLLGLAEDETTHLADECADESATNEPTPPLTDAALQDLALRPVAGRDGTFTFASFAVERCEQGAVFGVLLDPEGDVAERWSSNADVAVLWITDLDGDGDEEIGLHTSWLEDGMEEIEVVYRHDGLWHTRMLYEFAGA